MALFRRQKKEKSEEIGNLDGRKSITFSELEQAGYSLSMLGYTPSTGQVMVHVSKGVEEIASGHTHVSEGTGITISNIYRTLECTGELSDITLQYRAADLKFTPEHVQRVIPLKRLLDEKGVRYIHDPPLDKLKAGLDREAERLMDELRASHPVGYPPNSRLNQ